MSDKWDFYMCSVNDELASIFVDLGIRDEVPQAARPKLLFVWVEMLEPRPDGLSSSAEFDRLVAIEDTLGDYLREKVDAVFVGRITTQGRRELYFYAPSETELEGRTSEVFSNFPGYEYECGFRLDPEWNQYLAVLYPTPEQMQSIKNQRVLEVLTEHGDSHRMPRQVDHWIFLATAEDRDAMAAVTKRLGFEIVHQYEMEEKDEPHPFVLQIKRTDAVDEDSIDAVTLQLFRLCQEAGAVYDGWETHVVKDTEGPPSQG